MLLSEHYATTLDAENTFRTTALEAAVGTDSYGVHCMPNPDQMLSRPPPAILPTWTAYDLGPCYCLSCLSTEEPTVGEAKVAPLYPLHGTLKTASH